MLHFAKVGEHPRGTLCQLLQDAYAFEPRYEKDWLARWQEEMDFFYLHPQIADSCCFVTELDGEAIGFVCWDPRNLPDFVELGHNCIVTHCKGRGYGKLQLQEALRRIAMTNPKEIRVTTDEILIPAQKNYESCGFQFLRFRENSWNASYAGKLMDYRMVLFDSQ